ncbi:MAG: Conserved domain protein [Candidatus Midichloria mitochondrii]|uniref:Uncharacterized protein n=1 Tax=Midichloria mitochondrii (strain IricVA) TaxID=696127 RepID=F7XWS2_MIDMI|nr:hypothetical protein midi_00833 [Candidatus Midichloria mitochondrii IricVA]
MVAGMMELTNTKVATVICGTIGQGWNANQYEITGQGKLLFMKQQVMN